MSAAEPKAPNAAFPASPLSPAPAAAPVARVPVRAPGNFDSGSNVVFFGNSLSVECQRCGAFCSTNNGHKYCGHVTCPIALKEFKRRKRKRTSTLEKVYIPTKFAKRPGDDAVSPPR